MDEAATMTDADRATTGIMRALPRLCGPGDQEGGADDLIGPPLRPGGPIEIMSLHQGDPWPSKPSREAQVKGFGTFPRGVTFPTCAGEGTYASPPMRTPLTSIQEVIT